MSRTPSSFYHADDAARLPEIERRALVRERLQEGACCTCFIAAPCKLCRIMSEDEAVAYAEGGESAAINVIDHAND
jgi:hypothetical protein